MNFKIVVCIFFSFMTVFACKKNKTKHTPKITVTTPNTTLYDTIKNEDVIKKHTNRNLDFINIKAKILVINAEKNTTEFTAHIRSRADSVVWISAQAVLGIEVARILIKKDSIFILNKIDKTYSAFDSTFIQKYIGINASIAQLQHILSASNYYLPNTKFATFDSILVSRNTTQIQNTFLLKNNLINKATYTVANAQILMQIDFNEYKPIKSVQYPHKILVQTTNSNATQMQITIQSVNFDKQSNFAFNVPSSYKRL